MKSNTVMPWNLKVKYKLDGKEYKAQDLAGKSGKLEITISIKKNENCKKNFFENYALQTVLQLDTNLCKNIESESATMANVGGLKQLTYTILPGNEKDIKITTDVTDFEMSEIQVNGINLNLGLDKDSIDTSSLTGELDKLKDAVNDLDDGANELNDGAKKLDDGAVTLTDGIKTIQEGLDQLNSKSSSLTSGSSEVLSALKTIQSSLNNVSTSSKDLKQLSSASTSIKSGIDSLVNGLKTVDSSIDTYNSSLKKAGLNSASELAQKNKSIMWQDVFSFDILWLEKNGLYNSRTHELDERKIKNAVRKSIALSLDNLGITDSAIWNGAIHFNTDNIHIHVAICEPNPTKERGKKKQKTLDNMKSVFVNELLDSKEIYKDINNIIRD